MARTLMRIQIIPKVKEVVMFTGHFRFSLLLPALCLLWLCAGSTGVAQGASVPLLVKDIKTRIKDNANVKNLVAAGSTLFFTAYDQAHGNELWKTDGTAAGTAMVKDILPGSSSSYHDPNFIIYWNSFVYFEADGPNGWSLWKSDGTADKTVEVSHAVDPGQFISFNGALYFSGYSKGLWKTDGTTAGTVEVKGGIGTLDNLVVVGGNKLYFTNSNNLWVSDGATAGTVLVKSDIWPTQLTSVNGALYFNGWDNVNKYRLWKSDGTAGGTTMIPYAAEPDNLTEVNGTLFFTASDPTDGQSLVKLVSGVPTVVKSGISPTNLFNLNGVLFFRNSGDLYKSDGTLAGTVIVKTAVYPDRFANVNGALYFRGWDSAHEYELWKSDGTAAGTVMVKDSAPGTASSDPDQITNVNGTLYFTAKEPSTGTQLWKSNGTDAGTVLVRNVSPGTQDASPEKLFDMNGTLYFAADDYDTGDKLWQTNGMASGTSMVPGFTGSNPVPLVNADGTLYFAGNSDNLWKRVGSNPAVLVKANVTSNDPSLVCYLNGILYFRGWDSTNGYELWKSDGTPEGTVMVKAIKTGSNSSEVRNLVKLGNTLYFIANADTTNNGQLWKSDGTEAGTVRVNSAIKNAENLTVVNGKLFFSGDDTSNADALWASDGATTSVLKNDLSPTKLTAVGTTLFFEGWTSPLGYELWKSDGTVAGTVLVKDINPNGASSHPVNLTNVNGTLYFSVWNTWNTPSHDQLWKSDGTTAGTVVVKDLPPDYTYTSIDSLTSVHGILAFSFMDKSYQPTRDDSAELWISDGTAAGTVMVKDIFPGDFGSAPAHLTMANTPPNGIDKEALFFSAIDPIYGRELFILDFTPPTSIITAPLNNAYLRGVSFTISGTSADSMPGTGVNLMEVSTDNGVTWSSATDSSGNGAWSTWQYTWLNPADGVYTIKSRATDRATNVQTPLAAITVTVDNTPPTSAVSVPANGAYLRGATIAVSGASGDNLSGVNLVEVSTDNGVTWHSATDSTGNGTWSTWQYNWPTPADGVYTIKSRAIDRSGNESLPTGVTVTVDTTPPTSTITQPLTFHGISGLVTGSAGDNLSGVSLVEVSTDNGATWHSATDTSGNSTWSAWQYTWTPLPAGGQYPVKSRATDRSGNIQSPGASGTVTIALPTAVTITSGPAYVNKNSTATYTATVTWDDGFTGAGAPVWTVTPTTYASIDGSTGVLTTLAAPSKQTVTVTASYTAGGVTKTANKNVNILVAADTTAPTLVLSTLANNAFTKNATLNVSGVATDADTGVQTVMVNGRPVAIDASGSFSTAVALASGANTITVVATDTVGNPNTEVRTINLDQTTVVITIDGPADNSVVANALTTISGSVSESAVVDITLNGGAPQAAIMNNNNFTGSVSLVAGVNTIGITATAPARNISSFKRTVTFDAAKPALAITVPPQDLTIDQGTLTIQGTVSDALSAVTVSIVVDGQTFTPTVTNGGFQQQVTFPTVKQYALVVTATDQTGNSSTVQRNVIYSFTKGDVNNDKTINVFDALQTLQYAVGLYHPTDEPAFKSIADVAPLDANGKPKGDSVVNVFDALAILRHAVGLDVW